LPSHVSALSRNTKWKPLETHRRASLSQSLHHGNVETQPSGPWPTVPTFRRRLLLAEESK
jgi:hypothetical protein